MELDVLKEKPGKKRILLNDDQSLPACSWPRPGK
jgi:hypothetical protein